LEVGAPRPGEAPAETSTSPAAAAPADEERAPSGVASPAPERDAKAHGDREDRGRRGRRGRGRGRDREGRPPVEARPQPDASAAGGTPAASAIVPPAAEETVSTHGPAETGIGSVGERLTRDEAFDLVKRAVAATASGDESVRASVVRSKAFELLGRDSESLSERNFTRILRDAHDADLVDLRRRGDDYEVGVAVSAAPVTEQLNAAAAAHASASAPGGAGASGTTGPAHPRGLGVRGARRGGLHGRVGAPPPDLLSVGVVGARKGPAASTPEPVAAVDHPIPRVVQSDADTSVRAPVADATVPESVAAPPTARGRSGGRAPAKRAPRSRAKRGSGTAETKPRTKRAPSRASTKASEG